MVLLDGVKLVREGRFPKLPPLLIFNVRGALVFAGGLGHSADPVALGPRWLDIDAGGAAGPHAVPHRLPALASASVLVLLIVSVAVHLALIGLGLLFFGAEGRGPQPSPTSVSNWLGRPAGQTILVVVASAALIIALYFFFERTVYGKACATAMNRTGPA